MQADKGLQYERTALSQRRTALAAVVLMVASMRFAGTHSGGLQVLLLISTALLGTASLLALRIGLPADRQVVNLGRRLGRGNLVLCLGTAQIAVNVLV